MIGKLKRLGFLTLLLGYVMLLGCGVTPPGSIPSPPPEPEPNFILLGIATWNIERFDGAGQGDNTPPTRSEKQLRMIARILLDTGAAIIGLQEIAPLSEFLEVSPFEQIINALNEQEAERRGQETTAPVWRGVIGRIEGVPQRVALIWNEEVVEVLATTELEELRVGYSGVRGFLEEEDLRFPRIPLVGRFRLRQKPDFDLMVIVLHLKAWGLGFDQTLDSNDLRRRGELEDLLFKWVLNPQAQGEFKDRDIVILGDLNETSQDLVRLLDEFGSRPESKGMFALYPDTLSKRKLSFLFTDGLFTSPGDYTYMGNREKGEVNYRGEIYDRDMVSDKYKYILDHILISKHLVKNWDGNCRIHYFENQYGLEDHVHLSDHRPVSIKLLVPVDE